jgi:hypothetical protein
MMDKSPIMTTVDFVKREGRERGLDEGLAQGRGEGDIEGLQHWNNV